MDHVPTIVLGARPDDPADEARVLAQVEHALFAVPLRPATLGRYELVRKLGAGAFGSVYEARDPELDRKVAIKLVVTPEIEGEAELLREAQLLAQLSHPNVVAIHDVGSTVLADGRTQVHLVMELVEGTTLRAWLRRSPRALPRVVEVFLAAARGLAAAHERGIVHRDFKPDNVLVGDDAPRSVRVSDFGLARIAATPSTLDAGGEQESSSARTLVGTPAYMAPEQHLGAPGDARSDQYAFCIALWEAVAGARPYTGDVVALGLAKQVQVALPRRDVMPRWLATVLRRGLAPDPAQRFADMHAVVGAIERGRGRRRRVRLGVAAAAAVLVIGGLALLRAPECSDATTLAEQLWPRMQRDAVAQQLAASPSAPSWPAVERTTLAWVDEWARMHARACGSGGRRAPSALACLDRQRRRFAGFVQLLEGGDPVALEHALSASAELPPLEPCAPDGEVAFPLVGDDPALAELEGQVIAAEALVATGKHEDAKVAITPVVRMARERGAASLLARALLVRARAQRWRGEYDAAATDLAEGLTQAERADDPAVAAEIAVEQVYLVGYWQDRIDAGRALLEQARARVSGANLDAVLGPRLEHHEGMLELAAGDIERARAHFEHALRRTGERYGEPHPAKHELELVIAVTYDRAGDFAQARARYQAAYEGALELFGPEHPATAGALKNLAWAQYRTGDRELGRQNAARAVEQLARSSGPSSAMLTDAMHMAAVTMRDVPGACAEAIDYDERALALRHASLPEHHRRIGNSLAALARTQIACERWADARTNAALAREVLARSPGGAPMVGRSYLIEGWAARELGDATTAAALHRRALASEEAHYDHDHPEAAFALLQLGHDLAALGERDDARRSYEDALGRYTRAGAGDDEVDAVKLALAELDREATR